VGPELGLADEVTVLKAIEAQREMQPQPVSIPAV
jgi:hypothetical protein